MGYCTSDNCNWLADDDIGTMYIKSDPPVSVTHHSCSLCKYWRDGEPCINPEVMAKRIEYHQNANIFCCNLMIDCEMFERDYDKVPGYIP